MGEGKDIQASPAQHLCDGHTAKPPSDELVTDTNGILTQFFRTMELKDNTVIVVLGASGDLAKKKTVSLCQSFDQSRTLADVHSYTVPSIIRSGEPPIFVEPPIHHLAVWLTETISTGTNSCRKTSRSLGMPGRKWITRSFSSASSHTSRRRPRRWRSSSRTFLRCAATFRDNTTRMRRLSNSGRSWRSWKRDGLSRTGSSTWPFHPASSPRFRNN